MTSQNTLARSVVMSGPGILLALLLSSCGGDYDQPGLFDDPRGNWIDLGESVLYQEIVLPDGGVVRCVWSGDLECDWPARVRD